MIVLISLTATGIHSCRSSHQPDSSPVGNYVSVKAGIFEMGAEVLPDVLDGGPPRPGPHWDETPPHEVRISRSYDIGLSKVTQAEFARFKPEHEALMKSRGLEWRPGEPVVMVTWDEAMEFCSWLGEQDGKTVRLPTEAEWEYAARNADELGLKGIGDGIREWCLDWWAPYAPGVVKNPLGPREGVVRVFRNGEWWSKMREEDRSGQVLESRVTDRSGTVRGDRRIDLGFRVVRGKLPAGTFREPLPIAEPFRNVSQERFPWKPQKNPDDPVFYTDLHILPPADSLELLRLPYFSRHHVASITYCDNGDLLLIVFTAPGDYCDQKAILMSRLRQGSDTWGPPARFFIAPDLLPGSPGVLFNNGKGEIQYYVSVGGTVIKRVSTDHGATWSSPRIVYRNAVRGPGKEESTTLDRPRLSPFQSIKRRSDGALIMPSDVGGGGSGIFVSYDEGDSWTELTRFGWNEGGFAQEGDSAGWMAGVHNAPVELAGGGWLSFGRTRDIRGRAPMSISRDGGKTWTYHASPFSPISFSQRQAMIRLANGQILLNWFTDPVIRVVRQQGIHEKGMDFLDQAGKVHKGYGMFVALSPDEGKTWPVRKLLPEDPEEPWAARYDFGVNNDVIQTPDGMMHLATSRRYFRFNMAWLTTPLPPPDPNDEALKPR